MTASGSASGVSAARVEELLALFHLDDLVGHRAVGLAVHCRRGFLAGSMAETENLARPLVVPVPDITDAVLALHGEILLVSLGRHLGREAIDLVVNVKEERHGGRSFLATCSSAL